MCWRRARCWPRWLTACPGMAAWPGWMMMSWLGCCGRGGGWSRGARRGRSRRSRSWPAAARPARAPRPPRRRRAGRVQPAGRGGAGGRPEHHRPGAGPARRRRARHAGRAAGPRLPRRPARPRLRRCWPARTRLRLRPRFGLRARFPGPATHLARPAGMPQVPGQVPVRPGQLLTARLASDRRSPTVMPNGGPAVMTLAISRPPGRAAAALGRLGRRLVRAGGWRRGSP